LRPVKVQPFEQSLASLEVGSHCGGQAIDDSQILEAVECRRISSEALVADHSGSFAESRHKS